MATVATTPRAGVAAVETRGVPAFTAVDLAGTNQLSVRVGREQRVVVTADDNLIDRITTKARSVADSGAVVGR